MTARAAAGAGSLPRVLLVDVEPALADLLGEWLAEAGLATAVADGDGASAALVVIDIPFPRRGVSRRLCDVAAAHPGAPVLALSSTFLPGLAACGAVAGQLGVAAVLATPVRREAWLAAVQRLLAERVS